MSARVGTRITEQLLRQHAHDHDNCWRIMEARIDIDSAGGRACDGFCRLPIRSGTVPRIAMQEYRN
jgi:hypothetical protein